MVNTVKVTGYAYHQNGEPATNAKGVAILSQYEIDDGVVVPHQVVFRLDDSGYFEIDLWPNERGSGSSSYEVIIYHKSPEPFEATIYVPEVDHEVRFKDILIQTPPPVLSDEERILQEVLLSVNESKVSATASKVSATESANSAEASEISNQSATAQASIATEARDEIIGKRDEILSLDISADESAKLSKNWATNMSGLVDEENYSSKYYANQSKDFSEASETSSVNSESSADNSEASAVRAKSSEDNALVSEQAAKTSETNAKNSATDSQDSANASAASASAASTSETNAAASESMASSEANAASAAAGAASDAATIATNKADEASSSATAAANSESLVAASATTATNAATIVGELANSAAASAVLAEQYVNSIGTSAEPEPFKLPIADENAKIGGEWIDGSGISGVPLSGVTDLTSALNELNAATMQARYGDGPYPSLDLQFFWNRYDK